MLATSDTELVAHIQSGRTESESALYEKYSAKVYYLALRVSKSRQDAEDIRGETFLRVLQAIRGNQLRSAESLPSFILGVTRNVLRELYARRRPAGDPVQPEEAGLAIQSHERIFLDHEILSLVKTLRSRGTFRISNLPNCNIPPIPNGLRM